MDYLKSIKFNLNCPFHAVMLGLGTGLIVGTSAYLAYNLLSFFGENKSDDASSNSSIEKSNLHRIDVDKRFSEAIKVGNMVFLSGQLGEGTTIEQQTSSALKLIDDLLAKAGTNKEKVVDVTVYLKNMSDYDSMNRIYDSWIVPGAPPCRACIQALLAKPEWLVEFKVTATI